ncbi:substrate-binding domain-containing protein [Clostridium sp. SHJSY1]|uniref:substrate-binding domain-containing protein n=1 Tax=Clostridium sp. SHJSY1 TaxID=2942483 RepID=UPI002874E27B|nr:substrate-binding domain-containing protein [Clostridium sp. SHJSY1]MDS0527043.1 substrate-binding domain-containing protein [Clostridium sp. SHJSY1]
MRRVLSVFFSVMLSIFLLAGCGVKTESDGTSDKDKENLHVTYAFVAKEAENPYMKKVYEGFEKACKENGAISLYKSPEEATSEKQNEIINQLIEEKVSGIAIVANDANTLESTLKKAMKAGIKVVSVDSAVNAESREVHIQQADSEKIGRGLIQAAYEMINGNGGIAVLSTTEQAANQRVWISWMEEEIKEHPDKYAKTPLVRISYGEDDPVKSKSEAQDILKSTNAKIIIAPTSVGMLAAAKVIKGNNSKVLLTGLGLPSEMATFIENGTCPWMYLWNPVEVGYLAGYTINELKKGEISGVKGDTFKAGILGEKAITEVDYGGTEVMLGDPFKFDKSNIDEWKDVY